ncbi:MAG: apolipoprotein N-acyltransferase, partial [Phycisphaerales bacterium]|nr:apolipoprotein N-acyltransferase [Phycisphaerales bacterium]
GYGWWRLEGTGRGERLLGVVAIQTNLPQDNKIGWSASAQAEDFAEFCRQTIAAVATTRAAGRRVDLVAWPETMLPGIGLEPATTAFLRRNDYWPGGRFAEGIAALAAGVETPILVGSACFIDVDVVDGRWVYERQHNAAYLVEGEPPYQRYDKVFLTPFGEVMPYISRWSWLEERLLSLGAPGMSFALAPGASINRLDVSTDAGVVRIATPICFEDTVGRVCRRMAWVDGVKAVDLFVNLSNDGWFGDHDGGRLQHAQIARWRCIENRVPMVRCANTGLTVAIDAAGRIVERAGGAEPVLRAPASMWAEITRDDRRTLYGRVGETWAWLCVAAAAGLLVLTAVGSGDDG